MPTTALSRPRRFATAGVAACLAAGVGAMAFGAGATTTAPRESAPPAAAAAGAPLPASPPSRIVIERLDLATKVHELQAASGGTTLTLPPLRATGWDATSATPGQVGITVVTGYIARTAKQPGALHGMSRLREGDVVTLRRQDRRTVDYRVTGVAYYPQGKFPAAEVFATTSRPELRLISTGGPLHPGDPLGNAVVTAVAD